MKHILVFNRTFFKTTETFIQRQIGGLLKEFKITLLAVNEYENADQHGEGLNNKYRIPKPESRIDKIVTSIVKNVFKVNLSFSIGVYLYLSRLIRSLKIDIIHAHYGWNGLLILSLAKRNKIPLVVSFHGNDASGALKKEAYVKRLPELFEYASAIIICSPHMFQTLSLHNWKDKVICIPYGINTDEFAASKNPRYRQDFLKILHAGRIVGKKGVPDLIRVFEILNKRYGFLQLHILGEGNELNLCRELVVTNGLEASVFFYGKQSQAVVKRLMEEADIFVLNSRTDNDGDMEGLPNALLEAMSFEKAVVSTDHAGIPLAVTDMETGLLVPERDNTALELAIEHLINDVQLRLTLGKNARLKVEELFSIEDMNRKLKDVFERNA